MSSGAVTIRFPMGRPEYHLSDKTPKVGDVLKRNGDNWVVVSIEDKKDGTSVVTLGPGLKRA
jgi:hypothetical protein